MTQLFKYAEVIEGVITRRINIRAEALIATSELKKGLDTFPLLRPVITIKPSFDPLLEKLTGPVTVITDIDVTDTFTVVALTLGEISTAQDLILDSFPILTFIFNAENRIRALEAAPAITLNDFRTLLKGIL